MAVRYLIIGSGFTGARVARRLRSRGLETQEIRRSDIDLSAPGAQDRLKAAVSPGCRVLHSVPTLPDRADSAFLVALQGMASRVVYLSTTGVYGATAHVDERTPVAPFTSRQLLRVETEAAVQQGPWKTLILRPAAIYGPGRGVQVGIFRGTYKLGGDGSNFVSRIHVDDLAALTEAALLSNLTGAYPCADAHPCSSREIADFCAELLGVAPASGGPSEGLPESRQSNRKVDGSAILAALGVTLRYPSYCQGIPASLSAE